MLRMEIALFLVLGFVAYSYFSAEKKFSQLHSTFSMLLAVVLCHLVFDGITVYTVNHLDTVPLFLNNTFHRLFIGTMILIFYLFYQYIAILVEEETGKPRPLDGLARVFLVVAELGNMLLPIHYAVTPQGNYSDGIHVTFCYLSVAFYFLLGTGLLLFNWKEIRKKEKTAIAIACTVELIVTTLQGINHTWLISGMGITLITLALYLILENPDILRAELTEQKMSMLSSWHGKRACSEYGQNCSTIIRGSVQNDSQCNRLYLKNRLYPAVCPDAWQTGGASGLFS